MLVAFLDVVNNGIELCLLCAVNQVGLIETNVRLVRWNWHHTEFVNLAEFGGLGHCRTRHAAELVVEAEEVLQGDGGQSLVLGLDLDAFFGLDCLVQPLVVAAPREDTAGVLIDDEDFAIDDDVVLVLLEQFLGLECVIQEPHQRGVHRFVEVLHAEPVLGLFNTWLQDADGLFLLVDFVVSLTIEAPD